MRWRGLCALGVAAVAAGAGAGPAWSAPAQLSARLDSEQIRFGEPAPKALLTIRTDDDPATLRVQATGIEGAYVDLDGRPSGSVLGVMCKPPALAGPGAVGTVGCVVPSPAPPCHKTRLPVYHGTFAGQTSAEVQVPPRSESTLAFETSHAIHAPWTTSRYRVGFRVDGSGHGGTEVATPGYGPAGRTGVRIGLATSVPSASPCEPVPEVDAGPVTITGRSDPPVSGQEVVLRYATAAEPEPRDIGRVRAAQDGTFVLRDWRPPGAGHYEVAATYAAQRAELADDFSPLRGFRMRAAPGERPGPEPSPDSEPGGDRPPRVAAHAVLRGARRLRSRAGGLVAVRLACPAAAVAPCAGRLSLRARGRVLGARGVTLAPGARRTVFVRLRPFARRVLRRSGSLRTTLRVGAAPPVRVTLRRG